MALDRSALVKAVEQPYPVREVQVPGLGMAYVRRLNGKEKDRWEESNWKKGKGGVREPNTENYRGRFAALVLSDERGVRVCSDNDAGILGDLDVVALDAIVDAGYIHNGMRAVDAEEMEKNSSNTPNGSSSGESSSTAG